LDLFLPVKSRNMLDKLQESKKLYGLLFFLYLIPGSPKDGFTYFVGMLPVRLVPFMVITFIARMPSVLSSTLCGSTLASQNYWLSLGIFIGTIVLAIVGGIIYKLVLKKKYGLNDD
jgi:uncharacterized membrane protein YdjX (TVP38/TMEM64 family)